MPKQKTHRASAKRFKRTGSGGLKRFRAFTSHRFHGKTKKQRRHLRKAAMVHSGDSNVLKQCFQVLNKTKVINSILLRINLEENINGSC